MEESAEKNEAEVLMANGTDQRERSRVRRRLVQSTLFPHKSPEIEPKIEEMANAGSEIEPKIDEKANEGEDDNNDLEDEELYGSQSKKRGRKRKGKGKVTPQNRASKKANDKSPMKTTPKKNGTNNVMRSDDASPPPIPNLRLEAKLTAEENSRMFAGKQIHPFFTSRKVGKRSQETAEAGSNNCLLNISNKGIDIGPIHVYERSHWEKEDERQKRKGERSKMNWGKERYGLGIETELRITYLMSGHFQQVSISVDLLMVDPTLADGVKCSNVKSRVIQKWLPPPADFYNFNVDGAVTNDGLAGGIKGILKDSNGSTLTSFSESVKFGPPPLAELKAIRKATEIFFFSVWSNKGRLILETDCKTVVD
ncbi:uncharacterized protein LOC120139838 [Hibiscus syriacus]|uniref:uncharacterized protein LOC120139838 n=1 Tax=Hibiscus syriacus TaxID=106335 RepID=UPI001922B90C|nr:uncharacterized protein LOC120139838 [Hibiscus syriacus]